MTVSYATVTSLVAPITPAVTTSQNLSTTSTSLAKPSQYDFKPLLRLLLSRLSLRHESRPLRGNLAYELKLLPNPPIDISVRGNFKQYTAEAASRGLVRLGVGNTVGSEWIELGIPISAAKKLVTVRRFLHFTIARLNQADLDLFTGSSEDVTSSFSSSTIHQAKDCQDDPFRIPSSSRGSSIFP